MGIEDREYYLAKHGWNPAKLKGSRASLYYEPKEFRGSKERFRQHEKFPPFDYKRAATLWVIIAASAWIAYAVFHLLKPI